MIVKRDANLFISEVGDLLIDSAESFHVYSVYASNYPAAMKLVHSYQAKPEMKDALAKWMNAPEARGLSLESFLIKPVQRICKYPLLIRVVTVTYLRSWKNIVQSPIISRTRTC
jgi:hypothetical protein